MLEFINDEKTRVLCRNEGESTFLRDRKLPFQDVLMISLNKQGKTTSFELRDYELRKKGNDKVEYSEEAYLKQRRHLNPNVFKEANKVYLKDFYENDVVILEKGYLLYAIDGSTFEVPNTPQNKEYFGFHKNNDYQSCKKARANVSMIYDLNNKFYLDVEIGKYKSSETELAKKNIENIIKFNSKYKPLIIFDRGYPSLIFFNWLKEKNTKFLMRMPKEFFSKETKAMSSNDGYVTIKYTPARKTTLKQRYNLEELEFLEDGETELRITKIILSTGETEYLISNLNIEEFNTQELKELYNKRWGIETSYNTSKNKLKIEAYTGNLPQFVYQDVYAQTVVYNQIQDLLKEANKEIENKKTNLKHKYKSNENKAIGLYKEEFIKIMLIEEKELRISKYKDFLNELQKYVTAIRTNRPNQPRLRNLWTKYRTNMKASF